MFGIDFYPTPPELSNKMLEDIHGLKVYDPSSGSGNLLKAAIRNNCKTYFSEIDSNLSKISSSYGESIGKDFLDVSAEDISHIDAIIMNPPFSKQEQHILHAINIMPKGCILRSLCNYSLYRNPFKQNRRNILSLVYKYQGTIDNLGNVFSDADRSTDIDIGYIQLQKGAKERNYTFYTEGAEEQVNTEEGLVPHSEIVSIVNAYVGALKMYDEVSEKTNDINRLINAATGSHTMVSFEMNNEDGHEVTFEAFEKALQKSAWKNIFIKLDMQKYVTQDVYNKINKFISDHQFGKKFTIKNVFEMIDTITGTYVQNMEKALEDVVDNITYLAKNQYNPNGWKTNSNHMLNNKFIVNYCVEPYSHGVYRVKYNRGKSYMIHDLNKVLCWLTGKLWDEKLHSFDYSRKFEETNTWYDFGFLEIKAFKKGTVHCRFKDESLWRRLNENYARIKGFNLPEFF